MKKKLLILNGPGLSDLSVYDEFYGNISLETIEKKSKEVCKELNLELDFRRKIQARNKNTDSSKKASNRSSYC